jgi:hypothetical protein
MKSLSGFIRFFYLVVIFLRAFVPFSLLRDQGKRVSATRTSPAKPVVIELINGIDASEAN